MDEETKAAFEGVLKAIRGIEEALAGMATKAQVDVLMQRMNDQFERVLDKQQTLQVNDDSLSQRVTRLEADVRKLRDGT
jgi:polyhydroxyalkanoate synthesis regulator phasin